MKRSIRTLAVSFSVLVAVLILAGALLLHWVKNHPALVGLGDVHFTLESLSLHQVSLANINFGHGREQHLERLTLLFQPLQLLRGHPLDWVLIEGAELRFIPRHDGVPRLAGVSLPDTSGAGAGFKLPPIPVAGFELQASRLSLETGSGTLGIPLSGLLTQADTGAWILDARLEMDYQEARGALALEGRLEPSGALKLNMDLADAEGRLPGRTAIRGKGRCSLSRDGRGRLSGAGNLTARLAGSPVAIRVQADRVPGEATAFTLDLEASDLDLAAVDQAAEFGSGLGGQASLQAGFEGTLPVPSERLWEEASANGRASLQVEDVTLPGKVAGGSGDLTLDLSLSNASFKAAPIPPWELTGRLVDHDPPATFRLSGVVGHDLTLGSNTDLARWTAAGAIGFVLQSPSWPRLAGTASGRIQQAPGEAPRFDLERLRLDPTDWTRDGTKIHLRALDARLTGTASRADGRVSALLDGSDMTAAGDRLSGGEIELRGRLTHGDTGLELAAEDCVSIKAKRLELGGARWLHPVDLCIRQAEGKPLLRLDPTGTSALNLTLPSHPAALTVEHGETPVALVGKLPRMRLSAILDSTAPAPKLTLSTQGGFMELAEQEVAVADIRLSLLRDRTTSATLKHAVATSLASPPEFSDLTLSGKADGSLDGTMTFEVLARGRHVPLKLSAEGKHNFRSATGKMSYKLDKVRLEPQGLQPEDLAPAVGEYISDARGTLAVSGGLSWGTGAPAADLHFTLRDLGFDAPGLAVRGINTRFRHGGRKGRNRPAAQEIRVDSLDLGVPLRDGLIRFHTGKTPDVHMDQIRFAWGGGRLETEPFAFQFDRLAAEHAIVLRFDKVELNALLGLISADRLEGTGTLSGRVPLRILGSEVGVDHGSIRADAPGVLRYRPEEKPTFFEHNSQTEMLFKALQNFHYETLSIGLNGKTHDDLDLSIALEGANPDLYDGHPFKLNFNIDGELDTIIRRSLSIATFAEGFGELLLRYLR